jgi:O-antigen/teichoic acid export membrane protein
VGGVTAGLPLLLLRRASEGNLNRRILRHAVWLQLCYSGLTVVLATGIGVVVLGGASGGYAAVASGFFFAAMNLASLGQHVQSGRRRYQRAAATDVVAGTLFPVFTYLALRLNTGVNGSLFAIGLACAVSCSVSWTSLPSLEFDRDPAPLRPLDGLSFSTFGLVNAGYGRIDTAMLAFVAGTAAAGYYAAAYRLLGPFDLLGAAFGIVYFSRLSEFNRNRDRWSKVRRRGKLLLAITAVVGAVVLFTVAPLLIRLFYGPGYGPATTPARILLVSIIPWSLWWPRPSELASVHLERRATAALACGLTVDAVLVALVGRSFGAAGAAWAWVMSESVLLFALSFFSRRIAERVGPPAPRLAAEA